MTYYEEYDMSQPLTDPRLELAICRLAADDAELAAEVHVKIQRQAEEIAALKPALKLAVSLCSHLEAGADSRAVSNEFVALAAVDCGMHGPEVMSVIHEALKAGRAALTPEAKP